MNVAWVANPLKFDLSLSTIVPRMSLHKEVCTLPFTSCDTLDAIADLMSFGNGRNLHSDREREWFVVSTYVLNSKTI